MALKTIESPDIKKDKSLFKDRAKEVVGLLLMALSIAVMVGIMKWDVDSQSKKIKSIKVKSSQLTEAGK